MKKHRILSAALAAALSLSLLTPATLAAEVSFEDVPANHWAYEDIAAMSEQGVVKGVGDNRFEPGTSVAITQFATMLERSFYADDLDNAPAGDYWWTGAMDVALTKGLLSDTTVNGLFATVWDKDGVEAPLTRYDMAQVMYNLLKAQGFEFPTETPNIPDAASIPENYRDAVNAMYALGLLKGTDSTGNFNGTMTMDRAQACAVMRRLIEAIEKWLKEHFGKPVDPTPTPTPAPTPTPSTPATDLELVNKGGSTGIDPQRPVESAPPLSEIEIPKDKGLKVGESDEGLMPAGTKSTFSGGELHTIESAKYAEFSKDIIGIVQTEYNKQPEVEIRYTNITIPMYVGDKVTIDYEDLGYPANENTWWFVFGNNDCVNVSGDESQVCTISALAPTDGYDVAQLRLPHYDMSYEEKVNLHVVIYDKKPSSMEADFTLTTDFEPIYYSKGAACLHTEKGEAYNGTNGKTLDWSPKAVDVVKIKPSKNSSIPKSALDNDGYVLPGFIEDYYSLTTNDAEDWSLALEPTGDVLIRVPNSGAKIDKVITVTVTSLKDGRSCSIDLMVRYE